MEKDKENKPASLETNHSPDERFGNDRGLEENPLSSTGAPVSKEENPLTGEENNRGKEENSFIGQAGVTHNQKKRQDKAHTTAKITQGLLVGGSVAVIIVGLIMVLNNYATKGPSLTNEDVALSGDNTVSFRFDVENPGKMALRLEAKSNYGSSSFSLPSPWVEGGEGVAYKSLGTDTSYQIEGSIAGLRYGTDYSIKVIGNNKITDQTYLTSNVVTSSFDETQDFGLYWQCHCLETGYCDYQLVYPLTDNSYTAFVISLTGQKHQTGFTLNVDSDFHAVKSFYALDHDAGEYTAVVTATKNDGNAIAVKTATVAI